MTHVFCRYTAEISTSNYLNLLLSGFNHTFRLYIVTHFDISPIKCALWKRSETPTFHVLSCKSERGSSGHISRLPVNVTCTPPSEIGQCYFNKTVEWGLECLHICIRSPDINTTIFIFTRWTFIWEWGRNQASLSLGSMGRNGR